MMDDEQMQGVIQTLAKYLIQNTREDFTPPNLSEDLFNNTTDAYGCGIDEGQQRVLDEICSIIKFHSGLEPKDLV
jgi:hypothetical protein